MANSYAILQCIAKAPGPLISIIQMCPMNFAVSTCFEICHYISTLCNKKNSCDEVQKPEMGFSFMPSHKMMLTAVNSHNLLTLCTE